MTCTTDSQYNMLNMKRNRHINSRISLIMSFLCILNSFSWICRFLIYFSYTSFVFVYLLFIFTTIFHFIFLFFCVMINFVDNCLLAWGCLMQFSFLVQSQIDWCQYSQNLMIGSRFYHYNSHQNIDSNYMKGKA